MVTRRMLPTDTTSPKLRELTAVLIEEKFTWLKTLLAVKRKSSERDSLIGMVRLMLIFKTTVPGPSMMLRPASPKLVPAGLLQAALGAQNAAVLNHLSTDGFETEMGWPGTTLARNEPLTPRARSSWL